MTATVRLVRTSHRHVAQRAQVSVVRTQEPNEAPVWTIHLDGGAPIYVALSLTDANRVADAHASY